MPVNKNALLRYRTIDNCLRNTRRQWTLDDLIDACSDALYEYTGKDDLVSRRTIQLDIQKMRSSELGYEAPIEVYDNKYYRYSDPDFSITNTPLSAQDMEMMGNAVAVLKQLSGFAAFSGMEDIVGRLEDHLSAARMEHEPVIFYEKNEKLRGLNFIPSLYDAIVAKRPILMSYKSFKTAEPHEFIFSPYCLKEFRNRWFVYGRRPKDRMLLNLALDRIVFLAPAPEGAGFIEDHKFNPNTWFDNVVGVTKGENDKPQTIWFKAKPEQVPYIETKPLHSSQMIVERNEDGSAIFQIEVILNYEIERDLLAYGEGIKVLKPRILVKHMKDRLHAAANLYE